MNQPGELKVIPFTANRVANPYPDGRLPWQVYHSVRNAIVRTCRRFGPTGPMGEIRIVEGVSNISPDMLSDPEFWPHGDPDPAYFVIDDQMNDERYLYCELYGDDPFNPGWLTAVAATLREHEGWGLGISNIPDGYVLVFGKRLLVKGPRLARCKNADEVTDAVRQLLRRGRKKWWQFWK